MACVQVSFCNFKLSLNNLFTQSTRVLFRLLHSQFNIRFLASLGLALAGFVTSAAFAAGTPAGTQIPNSATLNYSLNGQVASPITAVAPLVTVAEVINVLVTWQDGSSLPVNSPDTGKALRFLLTNIGNGSESFKLTRNNLLPGDQFDPISTASGAIYLESGAQPGFQASGPNADTPYLPGSNDPELAADASRVIYLVSDMPVGLAAGNTGLVSLSAAATTAGAAGAVPGTTLAGLGTGGVDAVVGASRGVSTTNGSYIFSGLALAVVKTITGVVDPNGGVLVMPGAVLTYRVVLTLSGFGVAENLNFSDPLPVNTSYVPASITVDGAARSDAADADNASFTAAAGTLPATVGATFGNTTAPATRVIEFKAVIN